MKTDRAKNLEFLLDDGHRIEINTSGGVVVFDDEHGQEKGRVELTAQDLDKLAHYVRRAAELKELHGSLPERTRYSQEIISVDDLDGEVDAGCYYAKPDEVLRLHKLSVKMRARKKAK